MALAIAVGLPTVALAQAVGPSNIITVPGNENPVLPAGQDGVRDRGHRPPSQRSRAGHDSTCRSGASVYTVTAQAIQTMPGGDNTQLNQVVLQSPGVVQDSFGQLHVRGEHNGLQYRLNGVILPEGLSVFSQALQSAAGPAGAAHHRLAAGPRYGLRSAGIIDITSKTGVARATAARCRSMAAAHGEIEPSVEYGVEPPAASASSARQVISATTSASRSPDGRPDTAARPYQPVSGVRLSSGYS